VFLPSENRHIIFVELKQGTYGWIANAEKQLRSTINFFKTHLDEKTYSTKQAYIANSTRPTTKTNQQTRMDKFFNDTGYNLIIKNKIDL
jgi:hypothetical protein